jgi:hypothetical protein
MLQGCAVQLEQPKPKQLELQQLRSAAAYPEFQKSIEQILRTADLHDVVGALVRDPNSMTKAPAPATVPVAERRRRVWLQKNAAAEKEYSEARRKFNYRTYRWARDLEKRRAAAKERGLKGSGGRDILRLSSKDRMEDIYRLRMAAAREDANQAAAAEAAARAVPVPADAAGAAAHANTITAQHGVATITTSRLNKVRAAQLASTQAAAVGDADGLARTRREARYQRRRTLLHTQHATALAAHTARTAERHRRNAYSRGYALPHETVVPPAAAGAAPAAAPFVATYIRQPGFVTDDDSDAPLLVQDEDFSGGESGVDDAEYDAGADEARTWLSMSDTKCDPDPAAHTRVVGYRKPRPHHARDASYEAEDAMQAQTNDVKTVTVDATQLPRPGSIPAAIARLRPKRPAEHCLALTELCAAQIVEFANIYRTISARLPADVSTSINLRGPTNLVELLILLEELMGRNKAEDIHARWKSVIEDKYVLGTNFQDWVNRKKADVVRCGNKIKPEQIEETMRHCMTHLMPQQFEPTCRKYILQPELDWRLAEKEFVEMTRRVPTGKNTVAGQLHYAQGGGGGFGGGSKKFKKKGFGKGGKGGKDGHQRGMPSAEQRVHSGQSKGNPQMKRGKKRAPPNVPGGGAAYGGSDDTKRPRNKTGVPNSNQLDWKCHNCGNPGHFIKNCPAPRRNKAQIQAAATAAPRAASQQPDVKKQ